MATSITAVTEGGGTNAEFEAFVTATHNALVAAGLTNTTDTGQINPATVAKPAGITTSAGYEIWKFADTLQATAPFFFRIEYYTSTPSASNYGYSLRIGTGTDGAGNLTGQVSAKMIFTPSSSFSSAPDMRMSGSTNRFTLFKGLGPLTNNTQCCGFSFERTHNDDGTDNGTGCFSLVVGGTGSSAVGCAHITVPTTGTVPNWAPNVTQVASNASNAVAMPWPAASGVSLLWGNNVGIMPVCPSLGGVLDPSQCVAGYYTGDITTDTVFTVTQYGATKTYRAMGPQVVGVGNGWGTAPPSTLAMAMRWE